MRSVYFIALLLISSAMLGSSFANYPVDSNWERKGNQAVNSTVESSVLDSIPDGKNGTIIIWTEIVQFPVVDICLKAQRISPVGVKMWGDEGKVVSDDLIPAFTPNNFAAVTDENGGLFTFWMDYRNSSYELYGQYLSEEGNPQWSENGTKLVFDDMSGDLFALSDAKGGAIVAWMKGSNILIQRFNADGKMWVSPAVIDEGDIEGYYLPCMTPDGEGGAYFYLVVQDSGITYRVLRVDSAGQKPWGDKAVNISRTYSSLPQGYGGSRYLQGNLFFFYYHYIDGKYIYQCQRLLPDGSLPWGMDGVEILNSTSGFIPSGIVTSGSGGVIAMWTQRNDMENHQLRSRLIGPDGDPIDPVVNITDPGMETMIRGIFEDGSGGAYSVWSRTDPGNVNDLYVQRLNSTGQPYWPDYGMNLTNPDNNYNMMRIIPDESNGFLLVWEQNRDPTNHTMEVYCQRIGLNFDINDFPSTATIYQQFYHDLSSNDDGNTTWELEYGPDWISIDEGTGELRGTPGYSDTGNNKLKVKAKGINCSFGYEFVIEVLDSDIYFLNAPEETIEVFEDGFLYYDLNSTSEGMDLTYYRILQGPDWLHIGHPGGQLIGTPRNDDVGYHSLTIDVTNGYGSTDECDINITVLNTNDPPKIKTASIPAAYEDSPFSFTFIAEDEDPTNDTLTWNLSSNARWIEFYPNGTMKGTPDQVDTGTCWLDISVSDGLGGSDNVNLSLEVIGVNDPPSINFEPIPDAYEDEVYELDLNASDPENDDPRWSLIEGPDWLYLTNNVLWGYPEQEDLGTSRVILNVSDDKGGKSSIQFNITVHNTNDMPVLEEVEDLEIVESKWLNITLTATDPDPDDDLIWSLETNASWLSIDEDSGRLTGISTAGTFRARATVTDLEGSSSSRDFTILVHPDFDNDGIADHLDPDDDNDGVIDSEDDFPLDPSRWNTEVIDNGDDDSDVDDGDDNDTSEERGLSRVVIIVIPILVVIVLIIAVIIMIGRKKRSDDMDMEE